jgi:hypothetical protein
MMFEQNQQQLVDMSMPLNQYLVSGFKYAQLFTQTQCDMTNAMLKQQQQIREAVNNAQTPIQHWDAQQQYSANVLGLFKDSAQTYMRGAIDLLNTSEPVAAMNVKAQAKAQKAKLKVEPSSKKAPVTKRVKAIAAKKVTTSVVKNDGTIKSATAAKKAPVNVKAAKAQKSVEKVTVMPVSKAAKSEQSINKPTASAMASPAVANTAKDTTVKTAVVTQKESTNLKRSAQPAPVAEVKSNPDQ